MRFKALFLTATMTLGLFVRADGPTTAPADPVVQPSTPKFIIGVWYQPIDSFDKWKSRGINTLVGYEGNGNTVSRDQWMSAARAAGFSYIAKPTGDPDDAKRDAADPNLLAWEQPDEPDGGGNVSPDDIVKNYKAWKALAPHKPVFLNFDGAKTQYRAAADYITYCQGGDWLAFDYYILNRGEGAANIVKIGQRLDQIKAWAGGDSAKHKKFIAFIECSNQDLGLQDWTKQNDASGTPLSPKMRGPTADEMRQEIDLAVQHGASGIVYFPDQIGKGWEGFDGTPPDVVDVMTQANATLTDLTKAGSARHAPTTARANAAPARAASLDGSDITIDGVTYTLHRKQ